MMQGKDHQESLLLGLLRPRHFSSPCLSPKFPSAGQQVTVECCQKDSKASVWKEQAYGEGLSDGRRKYREKFSMKTLTIHAK